MQGFVLTIAAGKASFMAARSWGWVDRGGLAVDDGAVAAAGVISAIGRQGANLFALGNLIEPLRQ